MGGEPAPATPAVAGVTFDLPRRGRGNFFTLVNPKSCPYTKKKLPPIKVSLIILIYLAKLFENLFILIFELLCTQIFSSRSPTSFIKQN